MKRIIVFIMVIIISIVSFCSCRPSRVDLTSDQLNKLFPEIDSKEITFKRPLKDQIIGYYVLNGKYVGTSIKEWHMLLENCDGLLTMLVLPQDKKIKTPTENELKKIVSSYNEETGKFIQEYLEKNYKSVYNASFYIDDNERIVVRIIKKLVYPDGNVVEVFSSKGYFKQAEYE